MSVRIYDISTKSYEELSTPESYVFKRKREEVRLDVIKELHWLRFGIEYIPRVGAPQSNFVAFRSTVMALNNCLWDMTKAGCERYLRHISRCESILVEVQPSFEQRFPESLVPLQDIIGTFQFEMRRYN